MAKADSRLRWMAVLLGLVLAIGSDRAFPAATGAGKGPHIVMIIRHAEKPDDDKDPNLSPQGYQRADALAKVIPEHFPHPDFLIATKKGKASARPYETITPLSKALSEPIEATFKDEQFADVAHEVLTNPKYDGKTVLIAWHHGKIPDLAKALGVTDAPDKWNPAVFDRVWEITYDDGKPTFQNLPQEALPGDSQQ
jgi:phosphohistidine phosphatase SixA